MGESANQGILTRPFIAGGWTWTGWDYRGEPTPYAWPDVNSHFGIIDLAGLPKVRLFTDVSVVKFSLPHSCPSSSTSYLPQYQDRFYWYQAWFARPATPVLHLFPHWNWAAGKKVDVWAYSNADAVELLVNGVSQVRASGWVGGRVGGRNNQITK